MIRCDALNCDYNLDGECGYYPRPILGQNGQCLRYAPEAEYEEDTEDGNT